jgi:hypothetical protein
LKTNGRRKQPLTFFLKLTVVLSYLPKQPQVGAPSSKIKDIRGLLITRHNRMYYKIKEDKVIILNMYDTRMNPKKNPY